MKTRLLVLMLLTSGAAGAEAQAPDGLPRPVEPQQAVPAPVPPVAPVAPVSGNPPVPAPPPVAAPQRAPSPPVSAPSSGPEAQGSRVRKPVLVQPALPAQRPVLVQPALPRQRPVLVQPALPTQRPVLVQPPAPGQAPVPEQAPAPEQAPLLVQPPVLVQQPVLVQPRAIGATPPGMQGLPPPGRYGPPPTVRYRLPPPILRPIEPRRYGDAGAPFALGVGGSLLWRNEHAYRVLSDHTNNGALDVFATYDLWSTPHGLVMALGASLRSEARVGDRDYDLHNNAVQAEALTRYGVTSWLWPHVRLAVGAVTTRFTQHDRVADIVYEDRSNSVVGTFGAGFTLRTPTRLFETHRGRLASLSLGVLVEGGYTVAKPASLDLTPTKPGEVTRATFSLGQIDRSAPYLRIMAVVRL